MKFAKKRVALSRIGVDLAEILQLQLCLRLEAEHANHCGIRIEHLAIRRRKKDSFAQGFEELVEAKFRLMLRSDVAGPAADSRGNSVFIDHLNPAVEVAKLSALFQAQREPAVVQTCVEKSRQPDFASSGDGAAMNS